MTRFPQPRFGPQRIWVLSARLHARGWCRTARALKAINFVAFRAVLPPEAQIGVDVQFGHQALGVVIHPNVTIGDRVHIWQGATLASDARLRSIDCRIVVGDDVEIGTGAVLLNREGRTLTIGAGARIGANAVVTRDVPVGATVVGNPGRIVERVS
jgi:serine O-acetyltransferase